MSLPFSFTNSLPLLVFQLAKYTPLPFIWYSKITTVKQLLVTAMNLGPSQTSSKRKAASLEKFTKPNKSMPLSITFDSKRDSSETLATSDNDWDGYLEYSPPPRMPEILAYPASREFSEEDAESSRANDPTYRPYWKPVSVKVPSKDIEPAPQSTEHIPDPMDTWAADLSKRLDCMQRRHEHNMRIPSAPKLSFPTLGLSLALPGVHEPTQQIPPISAVQIDTSEHAASPWASKRADEEAQAQAPWEAEQTRQHAERAIQIEELAMLREYVGKASHESNSHERFSPAVILRGSQRWLAKEAQRRALKAFEARSLKRMGKRACYRIESEEGLRKRLEKYFRGEKWVKDALRRDGDVRLDEVLRWLVEMPEGVEVLQKSLGREMKVEVRNGLVGGERVGAGAGAGAGESGKSGSKRVIAKMRTRRSARTQGRGDEESSKRLGEENAISNSVQQGGIRACPSMEQNERASLRMSIDFLTGLAGRR